ncbi:hypothetical protein Vretimale_17636 [Volvox reticuliferus]|uniref:Uncharacterized protein n=1 Tax=Volvox reticuliferus TaxID=1737510 RepID=A0A8J4GVE9_9CHLO|nr:hypothetical protein Vretifemale_18116 [Volvox reticuliferus]GIM14700.1 hypothetical protein Vretimale_17636 [Volvox reticuliferus]
MDAEKQSTNQEGLKIGAGGFCLSAAHEVLQQLGSSRNSVALKHSLSVFENQLKSVQLIYSLQSALALEFGLHGALAEGCAIAAGVVGDANGLSMDPNSAASGMPDIFSVNSDCFVDRELVRALAWQANCQQEVVRKELRAYQRTVSDRLSLAAKRTKPRDPDAPPPLPPPPLSAAAPGVRSTPASATHISAAGPAAPHQKGSQPQQQQSLPQPPGERQASLGNVDVIMPAVDERMYCLDEKEEATRKAQLAKLSTLINPETGGISIPISVVGVFQQQMVASSDWRVRRVALEAMSRSPLDVLWRLMQNSRVLDCLHNWLQDALTDHQFTMLKLLLSTMACLPMRRDLLKGSKLEAALEGLAYVGPQRYGGGGAAAAAAGNDSGATLVMRNRFGDLAAAVLAEWRQDPDHATLLRRAGAHVQDTTPAAAAATTAVAARVGGIVSDPKGKGANAAAAAAGSAATAAGAAAPPVPGSRLLGAAAAAKDGMRKRALSSPRPMGDARASPRPRVAEVNGPVIAGSSGSGKNAAVTAAAVGSGGRGRGLGGTAGGGSSGVLRRDSLASAAPSLPVQQPVDMTAKLGEKGPADPDVVAGFRSRFGDGSVRRSQLARPARIPSASNAAGAREASPELMAAPSGPAATGRDGKSRGAAGRDPSPERPSTTAAAVGGHPGGFTTVVDSELGPDALARLRAERQAQRQAAALAALQAEARRHPEVLASELEFQQKMNAFRQVLAARQSEQQRTLRPDEVRRAHQSMRETVPWSDPPPRIRLPDDQPDGGRGEESEERQRQARVRQERPKVSYPNKDSIPDSPAEPPPSAHQQQQPQQQLPPRAIPWFPAVDGEEVALDWFRQNLVLWERGIRRAEHVLPPAILHRHLELHPKHLPSQYAVPTNPAPGVPSRSAAARHNNNQSPQHPPPPPPPAMAAPPKRGEVNSQHVALVPPPPQQQQPQPPLLQLQPQFQMIETSAAVATPWTTAVAAEQHALPPLQQQQPLERKAKWSLMSPALPPPAAVAAAPVQLGMMSTLLPLHVQPSQVQQAYEPHGRANGGQPYYDNYGPYRHRQTRMGEKGRSLHHDGPVQGEYGGPAGEYGAGVAFGGQHYVKQQQDFQGAWR